MAMDRTREFAELCAAMPRSTAPAAPRAASSPYVSQMAAACASISERATKARGPRFDARSKLEHLGNLVHKSSIFADATEQISLLISAINDELGAGAHELQVARKLLDAPRQREAQTEAFRHCALMEQQLRAELDAVSRDFKTLLQRRSDGAWSFGVRARNERRELFGSKREDRAQRARVPKFDDDLPRPHEADSSSTSKGGGLPPENRAPFQQQQQQQLQEMEPLIPDETYLSSRAEAASDIEAQVAQIGTIFSKVTNLISDQAEQVERIEANVDQAVEDVDRGQAALLRSLNDMSSNAATALKVGGIICATLVVYVIIA